jgi:hypothetical protein
VSVWISGEREAVFLSPLLNSDIFGGRTLVRAGLHQSRWRSEAEASRGLNAGLHSPGGKSEKCE